MARYAAAEQHTPRYARAGRVAKILGVSTATVWRWAKSGRIPRPRRIGDATTVWDVDAVLAALERAAADREAAAS